MNSVHCVYLHVHSVHCVYLHVHSVMGIHVYLTGKKMHDNKMYRYMICTCVHMVVTWSILDPLPFALTCTDRALLIMARKQSNRPSWLMVAAELTASAIAL